MPEEAGEALAATLLPFDMPHHYDKMKGMKNIAEIDQELEYKKAKAIINAWAKRDANRGDIAVLEQSIDTIKATVDQLKIQLKNHKVTEFKLTTIGKNHR